MKLSLARWDYKGSSAGWWMVRELPGVAIVCLSGSGYAYRAGAECWQVSSDPDNFGDEFLEDAWRVWGDDFEFTDLSRMEKRLFPSRSSALLALEAAFSEAPAPALSEVFT